MSPHLQSAYDNTQRVLEQARARSREQVLLRPSQGNGYEKHGGSPIRSSPNRENFEEPPLASRNISKTEQHIHMRQSGTMMQDNARRSRGRNSPLRSSNHQNIPHHQTTEQTNRCGSRDSGRPIYYPMHSTASGKENVAINQTRYDSSSAARVIEHSKAVTTLSIGSRAIMCAESIHDQIIDTYRKEIHNYSNLDSLYEALRSRICEVQSRRNMLEDSI